MTPSGLKTTDYPLFNKDVGADLNVLNFQETVILHELGHATEAFGPDSSDHDANVKNSRIVIENCIN
jgi:hypothetical protein